MKKKFFKNKDFRMGTYVVTAIILSYFLTAYITGSKYGIYDYLPHHYLFENPYDYRDGDIFGNYFIAIGFVIFFILIIHSIFTFIDSSGINIIKEIKKEIKKNPKSIFYIIFIINFFPWFWILMDYINVSVGYKFNEDADSFFPVSLFVILAIWLIGFAAYKLFKK